jgi:hypothetical protein
MAILGAVVTLALTQGEEAGPDQQAVPAHVGRALLSNDGENHHITLLVAKGGLATNLVVHDSGGQPVARLRMYQDGACSIESTESDRVRFLVNRNLSGSVQLGLGNRNARFALCASPDGSAEMVVTGLLERPAYGVRITEAGDFLPQFDAQCSSSRISNHPENPPLAGWNPGPKDDRAAMMIKGHFPTSLPGDPESRP